MAASEFQEEIWLNDTNNTLQKVKRKDIDDSNLGLGLHINPYSSMKLQYYHVMEKITTYTSKLQPSSINTMPLYQLILGSSEASYTLYQDAPSLKINVQTWKPLFTKCYYQKSEQMEKYH